MAAVTERVFFALGCDAKLSSQFGTQSLSHAALRNFLAQLLFGGDCDGKNGYN